MARVNIVVTSILVALCAVIGSLLGRRGSKTVGETYVHPSKQGVTGVEESEGFRWSSIEPSAKLEYSPCFDGWQCARLEVPMDWNNTKNADKVTIAIMKLPAQVPITDARYGGIVLTNPGGPGGSGIDMMLRGGRQMQTVIDGVRDSDLDKSTKPSPNAKFFDIVGFDPRGVNNTTPFQNCFPNAASKILWDAGSDVVLGTPETSLEVLYARTKAVNENCLWDPVHNPNGTKLAPFIGTSYVVRDMVEILEQHGQWREQEAKKLKAKSDVVKRLRWRKGEEPLQYWGISYGTILGATFAAMQPHRAQRMLLDAVADSPDYYDVGWTTNLHDTDEMMGKLFEYCFDAGPELCPMHAGAGSPEDLRNKFHALEDKLRFEGPIAVSGDAHRGPTIIRLSDLKNLVWSTSYSPFVRWERLARLVGPLITSNNGTAFAEYLATVRKLPPLDTPCAKSIDRYNPDCALKMYDWKAVAQGVLCGDGKTDELANMSKDGHWEYWAAMAEQSRFLGDAWAGIRLMCVGWKGRPAWKFSSEIASDVTAHPVLFAGNTLDNVTPMRNAKAAQARFKGSGLLEVKVEGHGLLTNPSLCAGKTVRHYFQTGELPEVGKVCLPQKRPFMGEHGSDVDALPEKLSNSDKALLTALEEVSEKFPM